MMKTKLLFTLLLSVLYTTVQSQVWDEAVDGDLSDDALNPSGVFELTEGSNIISANQVGNPRDVDFFAFTVPAGFELQQLIVTDYTGVDDVAFIGIDSGATSDIDFNNPIVGDLLGGTTYGSASIDTDILPIMGNLGGAVGFTAPLPEGTYTIWLNQTGGISEGTFDFVIGETLSVDDTIANNTSISLFPNPANSFINISSNQEIKSIDIYNVTGQLVGRNQNSNILDITALSSGIYLATVETLDGAVTTIRVIKE